MVNKFRRLLIKFGKILPFMLCFVVLIAYLESFIALCTDNFLLYEEYITLNTPISFWIASKFKYDVLTIFAATILSISVETCVWNKLSLCYLTLHYLSIQYIEKQELYPEYIYAICITNIIICGFFCYKGVKKC